MHSTMAVTSRRLTQTLERVTQEASALMMKPAMKGCDEELTVRHIV
jgi:hypothetical protein